MLHVPERSIAGIFVGGRAARMGGIAKGLLLAPDGMPIVTRARHVFEDALGARSVLVGKHEAYASLGLPMLHDDERAEGPLAGILALLEHAKANAIDHVFAIACDMPLITHDLVRRLAQESPDATIVAARRDRFWEPFFARYSVTRVLPIAVRFANAGGRKLQLLLDETHAEPLTLREEDSALLVDWDTPDDVRDARK